MTVRGMIEMLLSVLGAGLVAALALAFWPHRRGGPAGPATGPGPVSTVLLPVAVVEAPPAQTVEAPSGEAVEAPSAETVEAPSAETVEVAPPPMVPRVPRAESTEGLLIVQLLRGELSAEHYRNAMATLAAREEARNPMRLPGEIGPTAD
jgi:hypothetical protein